MVERRDYDALVQDINLEDITSCKRNVNILRKIRDGDPNWSKKLYILNEGDEDEDGPDGFFVDEGDDFGWLGFFVGKCEVLEDLHIWSLPGGRDQINRFFDGMSQNRSIKFLAIHSEVGDSWISLGGFFENNRNLSHVDVGGYLDYQGAQNLASALGRMHHNSLKHLSINDTEVGGEGLAEITATLRLQSQLNILDLYSNDIGRDGCIVLGNMLSRWPASNNLEALVLSYSFIDDEGLRALVSGMMNCQSLKTINLSGNQSITAAGLRSLLPLLQSEAHSLETLSLYGVNFGDDGAIALAEGLRGNRFLKQLLFRVAAAGITTVGWSAFSTLLCDTSTINNTYLSNHILTWVGYYDKRGVPEGIQRLLTTNRIQNRQGAAFCKILQSHPDLDMEPFFKLKMQFLPTVMSWFERVERIDMAIIEESERSCQSRKLSAIYKFVRGMPDLTIIGYWEGRMIHIEAETRRIADERRRLDDIEHRLKYEKKVTLERLGDRPMDGDEVNRNKRMRHE